jgi:DNA-directed RNA polymerase specialized sigma24 family protein
VTLRADGASDNRIRFGADAIPEMLAADVDAAAHDQARLVPAASAAERQALEGVGDSAVVRALGELPPQFRTVIYLADVLGYRYANIAALTGTPLGTVMSRIHRGRQMLRANLARPAPRSRRPRSSALCQRRQAVHGPQQMPESRSGGNGG